MKPKTKNMVLYFIASIFIITLSLIIFLHIQQKLYFSLLWVCYISLALISIGIITKNSNLILSQIVILLIPDLLWIIDFIILLITGNAPLGIAKYFFTGERALLSNIVSLQHIFTIPLAIFSLYLIKIKKGHKFILIASVEMLILFILGFLIPIEYAVNCLPASIVCTSIIFPKFIPYPITWLLLVFSFIIISYFIMTTFPSVRKIRKKNQRVPALHVNRY